MTPIAVHLALGAMLLPLLVWAKKKDPVRLSGADEATAIFRRYCPDATGTATVAADRGSALIDLTPGGTVGLLLRQGRRWNARVIGRSDVASVSPEADTGIKIGFVDFGWPRTRIQFDDMETRDAWLNRLQSLNEIHRSRLVSARPHA